MSEGHNTPMTMLLIIVLLAVVLAAFIGGPRYYRGRRTIVEREYDA